MSKTSADTKIISEDFTIIINVAEKYYKPKQNKRMMKSPTDDIEKNKLIEDNKKLWIAETI